MEEIESEREGVKIRGCLFWVVGGRIKGRDSPQALRLVFNEFAQVHI